MLEPRAKKVEQRAEDMDNRTSSRGKNGNNQRKFIDFLKSQLPTTVTGTCKKANYKGERFTWPNDFRSFSPCSFLVLSFCTCGNTEVMRQMNSEKSYYLIVTRKQEPGSTWSQCSLQGHASNDLTSSQLAPLSKDLFLFMNVSACLPICESAKVHTGACRGQKKVLYLLGLEFPWFLCKHSQHPNCQAVFLAHWPHFLKVPCIMKNKRPKDRYWGSTFKLKIRDAKQPSQ